MEQELARRILDLLRLKGGQKASELAVTLGVDRRNINQCLTHDLAGQVRQDAAYRWALRESVLGRTEARSNERGSADSAIGDLCRYYLDCLGQDCDQGVSEFAANKSRRAELCRSRGSSTHRRPLGLVECNGRGNGLLQGEGRPSQPHGVARVSGPAEVSSNPEMAWIFRRTGHALADRVAGNAGKTISLHDDNHSIPQPTPHILLRREEIHNRPPECSLPERSTWRQLMTSRR